MTTKKKPKTPAPAKKKRTKGKTQQPPPPPKVPSAGELPLQTAIDVRREMAKVYREARGGALETTKAAKLVWMLDGIRKTIETEQLEKTLGEIEEQARKSGLLKS